MDYEPVQHEYSEHGEPGRDGHGTASQCRSPLLEADLRARDLRARQSGSVRRTLAGLRGGSAKADGREWRCEGRGRF